MSSVTIALKFVMKSPNASDVKADIAVKVAVDNAAFKFDRLYSYNVPRELADFAVPGARVAVPFGLGNKPRVGVIVERDRPDDGYKFLLYCEEEPTLTAHQLELLRWLKETTFCSYFDAVKTLLPKLSRVAVTDEKGEYTLSRSKSEPTETVYLKGNCGNATKRMKEILELLPDRGATYKELHELTGAARTTVQSMVEKGLIVKEERQLEKPVYSLYTPREDSLELFPEQQEAFDKILSAISAGKRSTLLHGVTSSGKTVIYIKLIRQMLAQKRGAILLVPEIAIATQTIYRLRELFGDRIAVIHSGLSDSERQLQWTKVKNGQCPIVIGTRSAVFAPMENLGLIIIDEEQEYAYVSEKSPRYSAIAAAFKRAELCGCHLLLGSATPSVTEYYRAKATDSIVRLTKRYKEMPLPEVTVVDMRQELLSGNTGFISDALKNEIDCRLEKGEQVMLLLNRRGYHTVAICGDCATVQKCPYCDVPLVFHKTQSRLVCHYCGHSEPIRESCVHCGGTIRYKGVGTQRAEEGLAQLFPKARILRLDLDSASRKGEYEKKLSDFAAGHYDIIVGTQMIAKGLDFAGVTLAAVTDVDRLMTMQSYRVYERVFSMITQLVGRSGRGERRGSAIIQTVDPQNPIIKLAVNQDYEAFFETEIALRKACLYPPFCAMYTVGINGKNEALVQKAGRELAARLEELVKAAGNIPIRLFGPTPFKIHLISGVYRYRLTLKCRGDKAFNRLLERALLEVGSRKDFAGIRFYVDTCGIEE